MNDTLPKGSLVRHGETAWSVSGQHTGRIDLRLSLKGERDAQMLSAWLRGLSFTNERNEQ